MSKKYIPERGDIVWLMFDPQAGHEQAGRRPAIVISPKSYHQKVGLGLFCPITTQIKGYPFEVLLPDNPNISGAVLADQVKSLDWNARQARFIARISEATLSEVLAKLKTLMQ